MPHGFQTSTIWLTPSTVNRFKKCAVLKSEIHSPQGRMQTDVVGLVVLRGIRLSQIEADVQHIAAIAVGSTLTLSERCMGQ